MRGRVVIVAALVALVGVAAMPVVHSSAEAGVSIKAGAFEGKTITRLSARRGLKAGPSVVGFNPTALSGAKGPLRSTETALGNLVTDALRWALSNLTTLPAADVVIINGGAINDDLPAGDITTTQLQKVLPYGNTLVAFNLTGAQIITALENGVSGDAASNTEGRFPQVSGLIYTYNASAPVGRRITSASTKSASGSVQPIYPCRRYVVLVNDFMAGGGDGYSVFVSATRISSTGILATTAVAAYATAFNPLPSGTDGRITACNGAPGADPKCPLARVTMGQCIFPVGSTPTALSGAEAPLRSTETALGNLICDGFRWAVANLTGNFLPAIDACLVNSGSIRAGLPSGSLSVTQHLQPALPFGNSLVVLSLTGAQLIAALENGVSGDFSNSSALSGRFPQVSGVVFQYDSKAPVGSRILSAGIKSAGAVTPVDPCKTYVVLVNDFMAGGGDGYTVLTQAASAIPTGIPTVTALASFAVARSPLLSALDGRITTCTTTSCARTVNAACPSPPPVAPNPPPPVSPSTPPPVSPSTPLPSPSAVKSPSPARSPSVVRSPSPPRPVRSPSAPRPVRSPPPPRPSPPPPKPPRSPRTPRNPLAPRVPRPPPRSVQRAAKA